LPPLPLPNTAASPGGTCDGVSPRFFQRRSIQRASAPASVCRRCVSLQKLFQQADLIVDIEHGEIGF